ncbi:PJA2 ligase, partial [Rostratula benghalensis]|nr:PJA2 ligase [Rostratula benghalensis]
MAQEPGRPAWPIPAGGYPTITDRRYGRRYPYADFRQYLNSQDMGEYHHEDYQRLEWEDVLTEDFLYSSPPVVFSPDLLDEPVLENLGIREPICQSILSQPYEVNMSPFSPFSCGPEGNKISGNLMNPYEYSEDSAEYASGWYNDLNGQNGIAFVNIDPYEPDRSAQDKISLGREADYVFQGTLDHMFSELEKHMKCFTDLKSRLSTLNHSVPTECYEEAGPVPLMRYCSIDSGLARPDNWTCNFSAEEQAILKSNLSDSSRETQRIKTMVDVGVGTSVTVPDELSVSAGRPDQGNSPELVVRPKIRKRRTRNRLEREKLLHKDNKEESGSWRRNEVAEIQQGHAEPALRSSEEVRASVFLDSMEYKGYEEMCEDICEEIALRKNAASQEQKQVLDYTTLWDALEDCSRDSSVSYGDEYSSEWSDGEWPTVLSAYFTATERDQSSSDEIWETALCREDCEPEVWSSSDYVEENTDIYYQEGEPSVLEEGEIPWLRYRDDAESSSDDENYPVSGFVLSTWFPLHRDNSLEDDSSVSEHLDWRMYDEFAYGLWLPQVIPYLVPQFPTSMAPEEYPEQAVETAMVHLDSLGIDTEHAYPPATKETINSLPQIIVTDERASQQQCCTICYSDYVKDEIITELPCHHLFHRLCVSLWLEESGTCPVCRYVLAPKPLEEIAATALILSDHDSTPDH